MLCLIFRLPDILVGRLKFYHDSSIFFRPLPSKLAEWNSTKTSHMLESVIWKCMSEMWGIASPTNQGPKNHLFGRFCNLTANLMAYSFGMKHSIDNWASALKTTGGFLHHVKISWTLVRKRLKIWPAFLPTQCKFWILIHCQALQTEVSKRNSTKLCQVVDSKSC